MKPDIEVRYIIERIAGEPAGYEDPQGYLSVHKSREAAHNALRTWTQYKPVRHFRVRPRILPTLVVRNGALEFLGGTF